MSYLYNSRFSNSLAKDTLVRMSYSIGEKIVKSMAVVPVTYGRKDIDVFKKIKPVPKTQKINPKAVPDLASKSRRDSTSKSLKNIGIGIGAGFSKYMCSVQLIFDLSNTDISNIMGTGMLITGHCSKSQPLIF